MLHAAMNDHHGNTLMVYSGELGGSWNPIDWGKAAAGGIADATKAVGGLIKQGAVGAGGGVWSGVKWAASKTCNLLTNPITQSAAGVASMVPEPYTQITGTAVMAGGAACGMARGTAAATPPTPAAAAASMLPKVAVPKAKAYPAGSIATTSPAGYRVAIPASTQLQGELMAAPYMEVGLEQQKPANVMLVSERDFEKKTGKGFFRLGNPLMWAAFAGGAAVLGGGAYFLLRR